MKKLLLLLIIFSFNLSACPDCGDTCMTIEDEKLAYSHYVKSQVCKNNKNYEEALKHLEQAYNIGDSFKEKIILDKSKMLIALKKYQEAVLELNIIFYRYAPDNYKPSFFYDTCCMLSYCYLKLEDYDALDHVNVQLSKESECAFRQITKNRSDDYICSMLYVNEDHNEFDEEMARQVMRELKNLGIVDSEDDYSLYYWIKEIKEWNDEGDKIIIDRIYIPWIFEYKPNQKILDSFEKQGVVEGLFDCSKNCSRVGTASKFFASMIPSKRCKLAAYFVIQELEFLCKDCCQKDDMDCTKYLHGYRPTCHPECDVVWSDL